MMLARLRAAAQQLEYLVYETKALTRDKWWRWGNVLFADTFWTLASYRLSRSAYLGLGRGWSALRVILAPGMFAVRPWIRSCEISYHADIGRGLRVLHPGLGVVISGNTIAGEHLVLVGGNCIGARRPLKFGDIRIGDNVLLGANATILGPVRVGNEVKIGANAVLFRDAPDGHVVVAFQPDGRDDDLA